MNIFKLAYTLVWVLALPFLALSKRLRVGWWQRLGLGPWPSSEIWIQGASGGECALATTLINDLEPVHPHGAKSLRVLLTACTAQGLDMARTLTTTSQVLLHTGFFPFDLPWIMSRVLRLVRPKIVVLLETEIWPGLLLACQRQNIPVVVLNARMTSASLAGYLALAPVLRILAPAQISAIAPDDARRFGLVFGSKQIQVSGNIKFDRAVAMPVLEHPNNPLSALVPEKILFLVLGSVREEEEDRVFQLLCALRTLRPESIIGLFPRHLHRCPAWEQILSTARIPVKRRSLLNGAAKPGTVLLWDKFGELTPGYALAHRAFVGGSLARLGGQNFLEPLGQGVLPVIGPHWSNFAWVGEEIFTDLVSRSADPEHIAAILVSPTLPRDQVRAKFLAYVQARQGATRASVQLLATFLAKDESCPK